NPRSHCRGGQRRSRVMDCRHLPQPTCATEGRGVCSANCVHVTPPGFAPPGQGGMWQKLREKRKVVSVYETHLTPPGFAPPGQGGMWQKLREKRKVVSVYETHLRVPRLPCAWALVAELSIHAWLYR